MQRRYKLNHKSWLIILGILIVPCLFAQDQVNLGGMTMTHRVEGDRVEFTLIGPTTGWLGIGFNDQNNIVGSDLYLLHVKGGKPDGEDMYVVAPGDPRLDQQLGGTNDIQLISGSESRGKTTIVFSLPLDSRDKSDFQLKSGKDMWLILAYSTHDEFDHHSRMRKHIPFTL